MGEYMEAMFRTETQAPVTTDQNSDSIPEEGNSRFTRQNQSIRTSTTSIHQRSVTHSSTNIEGDEEYDILNLLLNAEDYNQQLEIFNTHVERLKMAFLCHVPTMTEPKTLKNLLTILKLIDKERIVLNSQNGDYDTALSLAVRNNNLLVIELLVEAGASLELADKTGKAPLHFAAIMHTPQTLITLLNKITSMENDMQNILLNQKERCGLTPLHMAVITKKYTSVEILLKTADDINTNHFVDLTPLDYAIRNNDLQIARIFLAKESYHQLRIDKKLDEQKIFSVVQKNRPELLELFLNSFFFFQFKTH